MSTERAIYARGVPLRVWAVYLIVLGLLLLFFALIAQFAKTRLAQKYTGPEYFRICEKSDSIPYPCISVANARAQMDRIIQERKLAPEAVAQFNRLIENLSVPASVQVPDVCYVNALQLNLALDKMR